MVFPHHEARSHAEKPAVVGRCPAPAAYLPVESTLVPRHPKGWQLL
jgi:hypothetical protein